PPAAIRSCTSGLHSRGMNPSSTEGLARLPLGHVQQRAPLIGGGIRRERGLEQHVLAGLLRLAVLGGRARLGRLGRLGRLAVRRAVLQVGQRDQLGVAGDDHVDRLPRRHQPRSPVCRAPVPASAMPASFAATSSSGPHSSGAGSTASTSCMKKASPPSLDSLDSDDSLDSEDSLPPEVPPPSPSASQAAVCSTMRRIFAASSPSTLIINSPQLTAMSMASTHKRATRATLIHKV